MTNLGYPDKAYFFKGEVLHTIFRNEREHFSIVKIKIEETNTTYKEKEIVVKGYLSQLTEGMTYYFYGEFVQHPKFGKQFNVHSYQTYIPDSEDGLIAYLSSDLFYGIGQKTAEKIVHQLGERAIPKILDDRSVLSTIKGLNQKTADHLFETLQKNQGFEHVVVYLTKYQIGLKMARKIYDHYQEETISWVEEDPYQFVFDIEGFGFRTADRIAKQNGLSTTHPNRIGAGFIYILQQSVQNGHVYLPLEVTVKYVKQLLADGDKQLEEESLFERLETLNKEKKLILQQGKVYLPSLYYAEDGFVSHLERLLEKTIEDQVDVAELLQIIGEIEEEETLRYGNEQFTAIQTALHSKIMILTGGPGTGKTTVVKGILKAFSEIHDIPLDVDAYEDQSDYPFILTAPTGRAAKRLNESTGLPAVTIHRLLGWDGRNGFAKNEHEQLSGKILIVDEFSMVDIWLAHQLFKAIPGDMQVVLVGDEDQLPSVGPGQVMADLLEAEIVPYVSLQEVYRQKEGSKIIQLAHEIKNDFLTPASLHNDQDFSFISCNENQMLDVLTKIFTIAKEKGIDVTEIQVLAPMYRSQVGITAINRLLQQLVNPQSEQKREVRVSSDRVYRIGDKVIQLVNQPEDGVFNGDIGEIVAIFTEDENKENEEQMVVSFDEKEVVYKRNEYDHLSHAYCISIHKSQGSEFPIVLLPVVSPYRRMLKKNLLYTAITRGKQSLIICGEKDAFLQGIQTEDTNQRYTSLPEQLSKRIHLPSSNKTNPIEEEITPYDFME
ncbi:MAG TPA: ATP-dependent RecD-like DNA helicase [Bacillota bacterium]|nr:ATP-dependent RecD-like DNA helicase [Bacillota bacterium]